MSKLYRGVESFFLIECVQDETESDLHDLSEFEPLPSNLKALSNTSVSSSPRSAGLLSLEDRLLHIFLERDFDPIFWYWGQSKTSLRRLKKSFRISMVSSIHPRGH